MLYRACTPVSFIAWISVADMSHMPDAEPTDPGGARFATLMRVQQRIDVSRPRAEPCSSLRYRDEAPAYTYV